MSQRPEFVYLTRLPPSPSGVALYAQMFAQALEHLGDVRIVALPPDPRDSQRLSLLVSILHRVRIPNSIGILNSVGGHRSGSTKRESVIVVEIAGRGQAEFWATWLLTRWPWRHRVWITVHDSPALSGGAFFTRLLDRRGGRRLAALLSATVGHRAETSVLCRAERVFCLSTLGCADLSAAYGPAVRAVRLPHVMLAPPEAASDTKTVFLPGYLEGVANIAPALRALATQPDWTLVVGACPPQTTADVQAMAAELDLTSRVQFSGFTDEAELAAAFDRAAVVVRWRRAGWAQAGDPQHAAVSGPLIQAMGRGCAIVTNDTRGIAECLPGAGAITVGDGDRGAQEVEAALTRLFGDAAQVSSRAATGRAHIAEEHSATAVASLLSQLATPRELAG